MTSLHKIAFTKRKLEAWIKSFKKPVIMSSFGKDSQVMTHLTRKMGYKLPIVYHRTPFFPEKNRFADNQIYSLGLVVYDWNPSACGTKTKDNVFEIAYAYQVGKDSYMSMGLNTQEPKDDRFVCGKLDLLDRPTGAFNHPWDLLLVGHKDTDVDQFEGPFPLLRDTHSFTDAPTLAFPLKEWSDDEIWDYIEEWKVPVQQNRYDVKNRRNLETKDYNNDYIRACVNCVDKRNPAMVHCPLLNKQIPNVGDQYQDFGAAKFEYRAA